MDNHYQNKYEEYIRNMNNLMFILEVTKCCGYSTFITIYKQGTLIDLYSQVIDHFCLNDIKELFFYAPSGERIRVPISKLSIAKFIQNNINSNPSKLEPIYALPKPVVYRLYIDDGHCNNGDCNNNFCTDIC
jgi:hypothetical protein